MNHCIPNWNMADEARSFPDFSLVSDQKQVTGPDHELVELLWKNGQVIMNSQTHRKPISASYESKQIHKSEHPLKHGISFGNSSNLIQEDDSASWLQYTHGDSLDKEFCSDFFYEIPTVESIRFEQMSKETTSADKNRKFTSAEDTHVFVKSGSERSQLAFKQRDDLHFAKSTMPPPKLQIVDSTPPPPTLNGGGFVNFSHFSRPNKTNLGTSNELRGDLVECSIMPKVSSHCGSNTFRNEANLSHVSSNGVSPMGTFANVFKEDVKKMSLQNEGGQAETLETTVTPSSGGSRETERIRKQTASNKSHKRKGRDADESECQSEDAEYESVEANKSAQRSASTHRSRAAEVHNLSERKRRDRINEKMKALQELIPNCNKSDKASMLDEAIEYLKSLQLQLQIMWMGSSMTPMMFPSFQHYISGMGMGMGHTPLPLINGPIQLPRVPLINQSVSPVLAPNQAPICPSQVLNPVNLQNQMQNARIPDPYAFYYGIQPMQTAPQTTNLFMYGSEAMQHNLRMAIPNSTSAPCNSVPSNNIQNGNLG